MNGNGALKIIQILLAALLVLNLTGCLGPAEQQKRAYRHLSKDDPRHKHYRGHYKVGSAYKIKNRTYKPKEVTRYNKVGVASWYGERYGFHGNKTANGDLYNKNLLTAAHRTLQLPSLVKVTNLENNRSIIVLVNDRGPFADNREIDMSERAATILGFKKKGTAKVRVQYLHSETKKFLASIGLDKKHGAKAKHPVKNPDCSINCHVKMVNLKYKRASG